MIYHDPQVYTAKPFKRRSLRIDSSNLCPPPTASVNRQIRYEFLPVFYAIVDFTVRLDSHLVWSLDHVRKMLQVFLSPLSNSLQASAFAFVSNLSITMDTISGSLLNVIKVGCIMSGTPFDPDELRESEGMVETEGLDWDNLDNVRDAYFSGTDSSVICRDMGVFLRNQWPFCDTVKKMATLLRFVARRCPQLRSHVLVFFEPGDELSRHIDRARQRMAGNV